MKTAIVLLALLLCSSSHAQSLMTDQTALSDPKIVSLLQQTPPQLPTDSLYEADGQSVTPYPRPYKINFWVDGAITVAGVGLGLLVLPSERNKAEISAGEFANLNRSILNPWDRWALDIQTSSTGTFETYSTITQVTAALLPVGLVFDKRIREDWSNILLMYLEANAVAVTVYVASPLGPLFQNKYRPIVYHDEMTQAERSSGNNRNSFYSGHVASAATATFFFAKVYSDYHPEMGNDKFWLYGAALVPPLVMAYFRLKAYDHFPSDMFVGLGVGALCGILVPELHHIGGKDVSLGVYSSPTHGTGLTMNWVPSISEVK